MCDAHAANGHIHHQHLADTAPDQGIRTVIAGKGGVGKSTLTALLARLLAADGRSVLAIDADEQRNLAATLGFDLDAAAAVIPLAEQADYIEEKTGARPGEGAGGILRLNPDVADVVDRMAVPGPDGVRLLVMGSVRTAGGGCLCPENSLLAATVGGMRLRRGEVILMDTHAGVEHFGRSIARGFDQALVVVDPTFNAVQVGVDAARLASELGIGDIHLVVNRVRTHADLHQALDHVARLGGFQFTSVHSLPYDSAAGTSEPSVDQLLHCSVLSAAVSQLAGDILPALEPALMEAT